MPTETPTREPELVAAESALVRQAAVPPPPVVTREELDLVKRTIARGATDDELRLHLRLCARLGVHPLDGKIHFTKRGGRYVPIMSIDFLRSRAAETGEMAGSDDAVFDREAKSATVTVHRLTKGVRYGYTASARFAEYCPPEGQDHIWRRMPHTMLGKCAEALALRKAFPQQLHGLYVREELEQARPDFTTEATTIADQYAAPEAQTRDRSGHTTDPYEDLPEHADARDDPEQPVAITADRAARLPDGVVLITKFVGLPTKNPKVIRYTLTVTGNARWPANQTTMTTINEGLASLAESAWHRQQPVRLTTKAGKFGFELSGLEDAARERPPALSDDVPPLTDKDIPF